MKSCTEPLAYGVERFAPNDAPATTEWKALIFHDAVACVPHWRWTSSICVASYTPETSTSPRPITSVRVPRMGPDVMTGEPTRIRFCAESLDRDIACTSFIARPGPKYGRTRVERLPQSQPVGTR